MFGIIVDIFVGLVLLAVPHVIFELKRRRGFNFKPKFHIPVNAVIGVFFVITYLAFRHFHTPWAGYGFLHLWGILLFSFVLPFILAYFCKGTKSSKTVAIVMASILAVSPITRPIFLPMVREMTSVASWDMAIPFNLCNISAIVFIIAILTNNGVLKNYMITLGVLGGITNNLIAHNTHMPSFWYYLTWESYFVHILIITIPIFMLLTGQIKPNAKKAMINWIWAFPFFLLAGLVLNPLWGTNFHFTKPIAFTKAFMPILSNPPHIFGTEFDPLYMACFAVLILICCVLLYGFSVLLYKHRIKER